MRERMGIRDNLVRCRQGSRRWTISWPISTPRYAVACDSSLRSVFAHQRKKIQLLFAVADALLIVLAFEAAYFTRTHLTLERVFFLQLHTHVLLLGFCAAAWIAVGSLQHIYQSLGSTGARDLLWGIVRQTVVVAILVILFQYLLRIEFPLSRSFLSLFVVYNFVLLTVFRWNLPFFIGAFQRGFGTPYHLVIVGEPAKTLSLANRLRDGSPFRLEIVARIGEEDCRTSLPKLLAERVVDEVIFEVDSSKLAALEEVFLQCDEEGVRTRVAIDFFPHVNSDITLDWVAGRAVADFFRRAARRSPARTQTLFRSERFRGCTTGPLSAIRRGRNSDQAHLARPGHLPASSLRAERTQIYRVQVPLDGGERPRTAAAARAFERARNRVQAGARSAYHAAGPLASQIFDR